jgi:hypothetical protein
MATSGYSGTPLAKKLGIKPGFRVLVVGAPPGYEDLLAPIPGDVKFSGNAAADTDLAHVFALRRGELLEHLKRLRQVLRMDTPVWVSWPKKASKVATDITEDTIREIALPMGYVDIKVCAVSEVWSGLKLVVRKELR